MEDVRILMVKEQEAPLPLEPLLMQVAEVAEADVTRGDHGLEQQVDVVRTAQAVLQLLGGQGLPGSSSEECDGIHEGYAVVVGAAVEVEVAVGALTYIWAIHPRTCSNCLVC